MPEGDDEPGVISAECSILNGPLQVLAEIFRHMLCSAVFFI